MNFESLPHLYHFVEDFLGVIDSRLPPMPTAPATDDPSAMFRSPSSSPGPPRSACTSASDMPGSILSKLACVSFLLALLQAGSSARHSAARASASDRRIGIIPATTHPLYGLATLRRSVPQRFCEASLNV